jgi:hypothetical protein
MMTAEEMEKFIRDTWAKQHPGEVLDDELFLNLLELLEMYVAKKRTAVRR